MRIKKMDDFLKLDGQDVEFCPVCGNPVVKIIGNERHIAYWDGISGYFYQKLDWQVCLKCACDDFFYDKYYMGENYVKKLNGNGFAFFANENVFMFPKNTDIMIRKIGSCIIGV